MVSFVLPLLTGLSLLSSVVAQSAGTAGAICGASQYASLSCLTKHEGAASLCSKLPKQTATLTVTTTTLDVNSITLTAHATSQTTVHITSTQWSTIYVTRGPEKTVTTFETKNKIETSTLTTYIPTANVDAVIEPTCGPERAVSSLGDLLPGMLATACSCIGHPARTTTVTSIVNAPAVKTRITSFDGTAPTTTVYNIALQTTTVTERPTKFVTRTKSQCTTSSIIISYAAPTFTQVVGSKAGCVDTNASSSKILPHNVDDLQSAAEQCKNLCSQEAACTAVYVQHMSFMRGGPKQYHCFFNDKKWDAEADLQCFPKSKKTIYGTAVGYDACDRGTKPL